jgi:hypothetical protein
MSICHPVLDSVLFASDPNSFYLDGRQVHYTARFPDGTLFDSSYKRGRPLTMRIGAGKVCMQRLLLTENDVHRSSRHFMPVKDRLFLSRFPCADPPRA